MPKTTTSKWKKNIRWFSAEFLVVVSGVLIALALNSFWQSRLDSSREAAYLDQIRTDIEETRQQFAEALQFNEGMLLALDSLNSASNGLLMLSDEDIIRLNNLDFLWAVPVTGTVEALVSTGELHLISNDSLRTSVIQFVNESETFENILLEYVFRWGSEGYRVIWESLVAPSEEGSRFYSSPRLSRPRNTTTRFN